MKSPLTFILIITTMSCYCWCCCYSTNIEQPHQQDIMQITNTNRLLTKYWQNRRLLFEFNKQQQLDLFEQAITSDTNNNNNSPKISSVIMEENEGVDEETDPCSPSQCQVTFEHVYSVPVTLPCSTASGSIPNSAHLPLVYPGDYTACKKYEFANAHYCTIDTFDFIAYPLRKGIIKFTGEGLPLGRIHLGQCVSKKCTSQLLRKKFLSNVHQTAKAIQRRAPLALYIPFIESVIKNSTFVQCVDENEEKTGSVWDRAGSSTFMVLLIVTMIIVCTSTMYDLLSLRYPGLSMSKTFSGLDTFTRAVSARKSYRSLTSPMTGDFLFLNGVRVLSIIWIIYGHVVLYSSGLALPYPILNPSAIDSQIQSFQMAIPRGAEYSVDTFFFMSGFLATWGTIQESKRNPFTWVSYFRNIMLRYLRLTPAYAFVLFFYYKAMPFVSTGPFYHFTQGPEFKNEECKNWWTNLLYINNLYPFGEEGGLRGCMGWSWYLANDMQFFFFVGPAVALFMYGREQYHQESHVWWWKTRLMKYGFPFTLIIIQISTTWYTMNHWNIKGAFDPEYNVHLYVKPWCRVSPYAVGIILAFWHADRVDADSALGLPEGSWKVRVFNDISPLFMLAFAFSITSTIVFSLYDQFRCKADPSTDCRVWAGFTNYGALVSPNWSHAQVTAYFVLTYVAWAVALAIVCMYFFSGRGGVVHDVFTHSIFTPLARLSYVAYLVHIPCLELMFLTAPAPPYVTEAKQYMDTVSITCAAYTASFLLFFLIERPVMSLTLVNLLPQSNKSSSTVSSYNNNVSTTTANNNNNATSNGNISRNSSELGLEHHVRRVADVDSEVIVMASPIRPPVNNNNNNISAANSNSGSSNLTRPLLG
jgi:peptidoglycan/LPS O-acetylase OafA/YrhL